MNFAGGQLEWVTSFSVKGDDPAKWFALTNLDRIVPIIRFLDDEGDPVEVIDDAFLLVAGEGGQQEFVIPLGECRERTDN